MSHYIDGFVLPIPRSRIKDYQAVSETVASIWKEHGALSYQEYLADDIATEGTGSFIDMCSATDDEVIVFGWVSFESRKARDLANEKVANDSRMATIVAPLLEASSPVFNAKRMAYAGFQPLQSKN